MAQRCQRRERQSELVEAVKLAYAQLSPAPGGKSGQAWICRGGAVCNSKNKLINTEIILNSAQFLAFAASAVNGLARNEASDKNKSLAEETARIALQHLQRWDSPDTRLSLRNRIAAQPGDVKNGSSALFLLDIDLWKISIYADLAGILVNHSGLRAAVEFDDIQEKAAREQLELLLKLFRSRTLLTEAVEPDGKHVAVADLDRGFERLYADNRYASYSGAEPPVNCLTVSGEPNQKKIKVQIDASSLPPVNSVGWDISHARRLVHLFDAIERNRSALQAVFGLSDQSLPSRQVMASFARQLRVKVWNQDQDYPLFTNYYSGTNGWYRVAYDNGTGRCVEGYPPYGLSDSFPSGGYATWGVWDSRLSLLGRRLYGLTQSDSKVDREFIKTYYRQYSNATSINGRLVYEMMFWPTLINK